MRIKNLVVAIFGLFTLGVVGISMAEDSAEDDLVGVLAKAQAESVELAELPPVPETNHASVETFIERMRTTERDRTAEALVRYGAWRERVLAELRRKRMPEDLLALAFVESHYKVRATSPSDAGGVWQILPATARLFGLRRDAFVDERYDPDAATRFAADYLRTLHEQFGDWYLAMAAYNLGRGDLTRLIESGVPRDFFAARDAGKLRAETADYVPRILAARRIMNDPTRYGFTKIEFAPDETTGLHVRPLTDLRLLETLAGVPGGTLAALNPGLRSDYAPPDPGGYRIVVPAKWAEALDEVNVKERAVADWNSLRRIRRVEIAVKKGMTLYSIGRDFDTSLSSLRAWNGFGPEKAISKGDRVIVYVRDDFRPPPEKP